MQDRDRLTKLGQQLSGMFDPNQIAPVITATICTALDVPYAALYLRRLDTGDEMLESQHALTPFPGGAAGLADIVLDPKRPSVYHFPILFHGEVLGTLVADTGDASRQLDDEETDAMGEFASHAAAAVRIVQLMEDVKRTRERVVLAREEERQRLRRNLHDGIGPTLAALMFRSGALRKLVTDNPEQAVAQLGEYREQLQGVITEIRRVVYNLRPPALDEIGMLRAIREQASQFSVDDLQVTVDAPDTLPELHPAVEVAAYRIACEAMSNVARHAQAHHCQVYVRLSKTAFLLEVSDDGVGIPAGQAPGVGFVSMHERVSELGGLLVIESEPSRGTLVRTCLPMGLNAWVDLQTESANLGQQAGPPVA